MNTRAEATDANRSHPKGLYILFAVEMWERFSYYGMRALLVLYLMNQLQWQPAESSAVYKWYTSLVYLTPLFGGYLADRWLGLRRSILIGAMLIALGHFCMTFEPLPFFYAALALLIVGNGFFKPNTATLVGKMYAPQDPRVDGAFTIYYMGINLGAWLAPLVCGKLRQTYGFHAGFGAAGVGMLFGLVVYVLGQKRILADVHAAGNSLAIAESPSPAPASTSRTAQEPGNSHRVPELPGVGGMAGALVRAFPFIMIALGVAVPARVLWSLLRGETTLTATVMPIAFSVIAVWMGGTLRKLGGAARDKSTVIFLLFVFTVLFWMAFEQAGNALNIWADVHTNLHPFGVELYAESFQSINPLFILLLGPLFSYGWVRLAQRGQGISTPVKMLLAMVLMAFSFVAMVGAAREENRTETRAPLASMPAKVHLDTVDAGRLSYDEEHHELVVRGVLAPFVVNGLLESSLDEGKRQVIDHQSASLDGAHRAKLVAENAPPAFHAALARLARESGSAKVSGGWLFLSYLLATLGELCLSPVGLSMVTRLAPVKYASLFMGVWHLTSSVAQYVGGSLGENWGMVRPDSYFATFVWTSLVGALGLLALVPALKRLMHDADST